MSDYLDDEYDDEEDELTRLEDEDDYYEGEGSGGGGAQGDDKKVFDFKRQLMLNFPAKRMPLKEGIMALHPDITDVEIPRIRNPRFCWVEFATRKKAEMAMGDLSKLRLEGGHYITVSWKADPNLPRRFRRDPDNKKRWVIIDGIPRSAKADEFKDSIIGVSRCTMGKKNGKKRVPPGSVLLVFNCAKNALEFVEDEKQHVYRGRPVKVRFLFEGPNPKSVRRRRKRQMRKEYEQRLAAGQGHDPM